MDKLFDDDAESANGPTLLTLGDLVHSTFEQGEPSKVRIGSRALEPERECGNVEYKTRIEPSTKERLESLVTQLKWRLAEGHGNALYQIGVYDDGSITGLDPGQLQESIDNLHKMAASLYSQVRVLHRIPCDPDGHKFVAEALVRRPLHGPGSGLVSVDVRIAMVGGPDAGKSTLLGVLSSGEADNGHGRARQALLRHRHELESGHTSSISHALVGYDIHGRAVNHAPAMCSWQAICLHSARVISLLDTCGLPRFLPTTIRALTGHAPDYATLIVPANAGKLSSISAEHLHLCIALGRPIFICITKLDLATRPALQGTLESLYGQIRSSSVRGNPLVVANNDDVSAAAQQFAKPKQTIVPVFFTSSVDLRGIKLLHDFLNLLPQPHRIQQSSIASLKDTVFHIEELFNLPKSGIVVGGALHSGRICAGGVMLLGPDPSGAFHHTLVHSIQRQRVPTDSLISGQVGTLSIRPLHPSDPVLKIRKGMVLLSANPGNAPNKSSTTADPVPKAHIGFTARVVNMATHIGTLSAGQLCVAHIASIRATCKLRKLEKSDDIHLVASFDFVKYPEYISSGADVLITSQSVRLIGNIISTLDYQV